MAAVDPSRPGSTDGVVLGAAVAPAHAGILNAEALAFLAELHRRFEAARRQRLAARRARQARFDAGDLPDFRAETQAIRDGDWTVAPVPAPLQDRRVEITGPVDRKMIINALNSGAKVFMADFEDSTSPTWTNQLDGQVNLRDAVAGSIEYTSPEGKRYALAAKGLGPFWYLPKLQCFEEAALWDEVMAFAEVRLGLPIGTMKVTVLIETLPAVFEMDEILHALKGRIAGLNCGRWDYIFSYIKTFRAHRDRVLPERSQITMAQGFLKAYSDLLIRTCHRRGAHAMGGMAAQIPIGGDAEANEKALARVRADKEREARAGHDGTWVAHPGLIPVAQGIFDALMPTPNQIHVAREDARAERDLLIAPIAGSITREGFLNNIDVCVRYLAAWLDGLGCVPIHHLMEDAATAEISRAQLWQWLHVGGQVLDDGAPVDFALFDAAISSIAERLPQAGLPGQQRIAEAAGMLAEMTHAQELVEFLTLPAYERLP